MEAINNYVIMCKDPDFSQRKARILNATNREVFPEVAIWDGKSSVYASFCFYEDEQSFKESFYEGSSIAVYTAQIQLFSKFASYGVKVEI